MVRPQMSSLLGPNLEKNLIVKERIFIESWKYGGAICMHCALLYFRDGFRFLHFRSMNLGGVLYQVAFVWGIGIFCWWLVGQLL